MISSINSASSDRTLSWWQRRIVAPVVQQLTQGVSPAKLAAAVAIGGVIAINPFLGTTTIACLAAGAVFRLNQPVMQVCNVVATPLHLALIVPWVRCGEWLFNAVPVSIAPAEIVSAFAASPLAFVRRFGLSGLHAATAWLLAAPLIAALLYAIAVPAFRFAAKPLQPGKGGA